MKTRIALLAVALSSMASAHRLDEYLQLTALSIAPGRVGARMILTPGVAVAKRIVALIDANRDGVLSEGERRAYAARVLGDVSLSLDGRFLRPRVVAFRFPGVTEMAQGVGEIEIDLAADAPSGAGGHRLAFENRHQKAIAAYLVECFVPEDSRLRITNQARSREQERYEMRYTQA